MNTSLAKHTLNRASVSDIALLVFVAAAALIPYWLIDIPPVTDLPQHLAQTRLLEQVLSSSRQDLILTPWYYPNTLIYLILIWLWQCFSPAIVGKFGVSLLAAFWLVATWILAHSRGRATESWLATTPIVFNFLFSWGLLNFLLGWPLFCGFIVAWHIKNEKSSLFLVFAFGILLYYAHALWFLMASAWAGVIFLSGVGEKKRQWCRLLALVPAWVLALVWYPQLSASRSSSGVDTSVMFGKFPHERMEFSYLTDAILGSVYSDIEYAYCAFIVVWLVAVLVVRRRDLDKETDKPLFIAAWLLILAFWTLPSIYMNTIYFNHRWLPAGITLLVLALPSPGVWTRGLMVAASCYVLAFSIITNRIWNDWQEEQLNGFNDAIALIKGHDKVISVNFLGGSMYTKGRPELQLFAYAQANHGAEIHFSFTEHYSGAVQFRAPPQVNPNRILLWSPGTLRRENLKGFTVLLVNAAPEMHARFSQLPELTPVSQHTASATWRIYRIAPG